MGALNRQITVSTEDYEKRMHTPMSQSLEDAFNDILSNFTEMEIDKRYNSEMNQFLKNDKGDTYYFDNFKYVFPMEIGEGSEPRVLNGNVVGRGNFCCVRYTGQAIIAEKYGDNQVEICSYFLTNESRNYISENMKGDMGNFLLQVSGNNMSYIEKLHLGSKVVVKREDEKLVSYDVTGQAIGAVGTSRGNSFYKDVQTKVNIMGLLLGTYSVTQENNVVEETGPVR